MSEPRPASGPLSWGEIKRQVEGRGVTDDSPVFLIDLGPNASEVHVLIDEAGVEIADDPILLRPCVG